MIQGPAQQLKKHKRKIRTSIIIANPEMYVVGEIILITC
jgi:hypothetical protein